MEPDSSNIHAIRMESESDCDQKTHVKPSCATGDAGNNRYMNALKPIISEFKFYYSSLSDGFKSYDAKQSPEISTDDAFQSRSSSIYDSSSLNRDFDRIDPTSRAFQEECCKTKTTRIDATESACTLEPHISQCEQGTVLLSFTSDHVTDPVGNQTEIANAYAREQDSFQMDAEKDALLEFNDVKSADTTDDWKNVQNSDLPSQNLANLSNSQERKLITEPQENQAGSWSPCTEQHQQDANKEEKVTVSMPSSMGLLLLQEYDSESEENVTVNDSLTWRETNEECEPVSSQNDESDLDEPVMRIMPVHVPLEPPPRTKGELLPEDLPPIEQLRISVSSQECALLGELNSIVGSLVVVAALPGTPALDLDSVLFIEEGKIALGKVFDVMGPVARPFYVVRFNNTAEIQELGLAPGVPVYYAPYSPYVCYVFLEHLQQIKGSDASWEDNNEPPPQFLDYSDDEEEARSRKRNELTNKRKWEERGADPRNLRYLGPTQENTPQFTLSCPSQSGPPHSLLFSSMTFH